ncbi:penicillin-binding transpeptidase domain-containing protein [Stappia indica]|uniref:Class D beta-lactamase n=1 Tax=Stappia indica TaxID=538381 RepID=A0A857C3D7_9HYPH|nr:penicillin-binding transpeptidase domain-containing protein [Stappia indica]QGZ33378.1 class D beta-lactamase [Stappia indica]
MARITGAAFAVLVPVMGAAAAPAQAGVLCTMVIESQTRSVLLEEGDCAARVTPASTFKVPLAAIGYEEGVLDGAHSPVWTWARGEVDWGGDAWRGDVDPLHWMEHSVVWYSQRMARQLGRAVLEQRTSALGFGNADFSGDPGEDNGLERAWIASSLTVSGREQALFLTKLVNRTLPLSERAQAQAEALLPAHEAGAGWTLTGKPGGAYPRRADGSFDRSRGYGWFVGWAEAKGAGEGRRLVFVRLVQDETRKRGSPGRRARAAFLKEWPAIAKRLPAGGPPLSGDN